jgi:hypothetical protein
MTHHWAQSLANVNSHKSAIAVSEVITLDREMSLAERSE